MPYPYPMTDAQILGTLERSRAIKFTNAQNPTWNVDYLLLAFLWNEMDMVVTEAPREIPGTIKIYDVTGTNPPTNVPVKIYLGNIPASTQLFTLSVHVNEPGTSGTIIIALAGSAKAAGNFGSVNGRSIDAYIGSENLFIAFSGMGYPLQYTPTTDFVNGSRGGNINVTAGNGNDLHLLAGSGGKGSDGRDADPLLCKFLPLQGGTGRNGGNGGNITVTVNDGNYLYLRAGKGGDGGRGGRSCSSPRILSFIPVRIPATGRGGRAGNGGNISVTFATPNNTLDWEAAAGGTGGRSSDPAMLGTNGTAGQQQRN